MVKLMSETGGAMVARGVLDAASLVGGSCPDRNLSGTNSVMECGGRLGGAAVGADVAAVGVSAARAALGVALIALTDPTQLQALAPASGIRADLDLESLALTEPGRYRIVGAHNALPLHRPAACKALLFCASELDPRRAIHWLPETR